jgi:outer membrane protein OmpA-like peptidoglycan-associated protein
MTGPNDSTHFPYDAFISYSHHTGRRLAARIQDALQEIAKPWNKAKALNIFRDETNLATSPHLWADIERALSQSRHFILLCTPETSVSPWIKKEIEYWVKNRPIQNFHIAWLSGEFAMDNILNQIIWAETNVLPASLSDHFITIPNYLDLRKYRDVSELNIEVNTEFRSDLLKLAAALHNISVEILDGRHIREYRKAKLFRRLAIGLLATTSIVILTIGLLLIQRNKELSNSKATLQQSNIRLDSVNKNLVAANEDILRKDGQIKQDRDSIARQNQRNIQLNDSLLQVTNNLNAQLDFITEVIDHSKKTEVNWENYLPAETNMVRFKPKLVTMYFDYDKTALSPSEAQDLDVVVSFLIQYPAYKIEVTGYPEPNQTAAYAQRLGNSKARNIANYIASKGIERERIISRSFSPSAGVSEFPFKNPDKRIQSLVSGANRKVDIRLVLFEDIKIER